MANLSVRILYNVRATKAAFGMVLAAAALESRCPRWTMAGNSLGGWTYELVHGLRRDELLDSSLAALHAPITIIWGAGGEDGVHGERRP